ncbi:hypothetical protein M513_02363 [Trichuris suis]|uniref:Uncharacterized protein n=1 Tax=Trichuris suis TaxID=68888 RepID=A0A085MHJ1_9BILA|nr:hypothetical protein M513_02363 [Trichuris suis]
MYALRMRRPISAWNLIYNVLEMQEWDPKSMLCLKSIRDLAANKRTTALKANFYNRFFQICLNYWYDIGSKVLHKINFYKKRQANQITLISEFSIIRTTPCNNFFGKSSF